MNAQRSEQSGLSRQDTGSTMSDAMPALGLPTVSDTGAPKTPQDQLTPAKTHVDDFPSLNRCLGDYQLIAEVAHGGMGIVFKAHDPAGNIVALKTVRHDRLSGSEFAQRFAREVHAAQQLKHANVMPILDVGESDGYPFFTMAFVIQGSLSQHRARFFQGDPRAAVRLIEQVARGVQHAHDHGILHRDLKPGNILLGDGDIPRVSDFGLAKILGSDGDLTRTGQLLGTTPYMAPEQATGRIHEIGPRSDVWSLGVILYELLAGRRPFVADDDVLLIQQIQNDAPTPPSNLRPEIAAELDAIVLKCLQKKADDRYGSAGELADDLARWLAGRSITLGRLSLSRRMKRGVKRHPWLLTAGLAVVALTIMAAIVLPRLDLAAIFAPVAVIPRLNSDQPSDPERVRREQVAKLGRGQMVEWIPEKGYPHSPEVMLTSSSAKSDLASDGSYTINTLDLCLQEFLPDPKCERFRLHGWVRHNDNAEDGLIGFYFGHSRHQQARPHHFYAVFGFAETGDEAGNFRLDLLHQTAADNGVQQLGRQGTPIVVKLRQDERRLGAWRELDIEFGPEKIRATADNKATRELSRAPLDIRIKLLLKGLPHFDPTPSFAPHGGVGLFVYRGSASFKSVTIQPLRSPNS